MIINSNCSNEIKNKLNTSLHCTVLTLQTEEISIDIKENMNDQNTLLVSRSLSVGRCKWIRHW